MFRLTEDAALINRMGFNNQGLDRVAARLSNRHGGVVGANIGRNKDADDAERDYAAAAGRLAPLVEYLVINVSSPNTPGLRALQDKDALGGLIRRVRAAIRDSVVRPPALLVKIAPDLAADDEAGIAALAEEAQLQGLIISNTTIERPASLTSPHRGEAGGLSGVPLMTPSTAQLARMYKATGGRIPLIGVGGVASGGDAYAKIRAGASLVQLYTALALQGPPLLAEIKADLARLLRSDGFRSVAEAVGADHA
jgi:dihydroorotate dehydrogenase